MKIEVVECPRRTCRYRWMPRVNKPKECPNCKHRFAADWGEEPILVVHQVKSKDDLLRLRRELKQWNEKGRWEAD